jgi:metallo-beta-lactamase class B
MQILHNIFQVGGDLNGITFDRPGALWNDGNTYLIKTERGLILFDCGCGDTLDQIFDNMRYWNLNPEDIQYCILTHAHFDHAGAGHLLKKQGVQFISLEDTALAVKTGDERCCGYLYHKTFTPFEVDQTLSDGALFDVLGLQIQAIHVPGHSAGCTAFLFEWEGKQVAISGDLIGTLLSGDFGWSGSIDFDKQKYIHSLLKFSKFNPDIMLPGHGLIYFHKPQHRVEEALNAALMQWR